MGDIGNNEVSLELGAGEFKDISPDSGRDSGRPSSHQRPSRAPCGEGSLSRANPGQEPAPLLWKNASCCKKPDKTMLLPGEGVRVEMGEELCGSHA